MSQDPLEVRQTLAEALDICEQQLQKAIAATREARNALDKPRKAHRAVDQIVMECPSQLGLVMLHEVAAIYVELSMGNAGGNPNMS